MGKVTMADTVFVVDDDPAIRELVSATLRRMGCAVQTFDSGAALHTPEVCDRIFSVDMDPLCILLDLIMPEISGIDLLEELQKYVTGEIVKDGGPPKVPCPPPVIVMTAKGSISAAVKSMKLGACDFLEKPFTTED